jgi:hypothetical protein
MNLSEAGCMSSMQQQTGTWKPSQHLLETKKTCVEVAGRRTFGCVLTSSLEYGKQRTW